jgi:hypothetical protein
MLDSRLNYNIGSNCIFYFIFSFAFLGDLKNFLTIYVIFEIF